MATLTKDEKLQILSSHKRNVEYSKYGFELDIIQENAKKNPNTEEISKLEDLVEDLDSQLSALNAELTKVNALTE